MESIRIGVVRSRRYRAGDGFHIYADGGNGTMDWDHPITPRKVMLREDAPLPAGQHLGGHIMGPHLGGIRPDGHLEGTFLLDERGYPAAVVAYETEPMVFGRFRYAVAMEDAVGNALIDGLAIHEAVVNSAPPAAGPLHPAAYDAQTHQLAFSFTPSPHLIG